MATIAASTMPASAANTIYAADGDLLSDRVVSSSGGYHLELEAELRVGDQSLYVTSPGKLVLVDAGGSNYWQVSVAADGSLTTTATTAPS